MICDESIRSVHSGRHTARKKGRKKRSLNRYNMSVTKIRHERWKIKEEIPKKKMNS